MVRTSFLHFLRRNAVLFVILALSGIVHGVNMFSFPAYREDEGTYLSQAHAIIETQTLAPYTYWYDHAPGGWILLALWEWLVGEHLPVEVAINSGRLFMLVVQVASAALVYALAMQITGRKEAAIVAAALFSFVPLSIVAHRRVLLDNIMVFWFLLSLYFLSKPIRLRHVILGAIAFSFSFFSKESAIAFLPILTGVVAIRAHRNHRHFAIVAWIAVTVLTMSIYPLFALLKGEFFPSGTWLGGDQPHVSLWEAIVFQMSRDGGFFLSPDSSFRYALSHGWLLYGGTFLFLGALATVTHLCFGKERWRRFLALLSLSYVFFVIRGQVLDWYVIPIIPLFSLSLGLAVGDVRRFIRRYMPAYEKDAVIVSATLIVAIALVPVLRVPYIFFLDQTENQTQAITWVKKYIPPDRTLLIDNYAFLDLNGIPENITDTRTHYYWKVDTDPQIRDGILDGRWENIDYLLFTPAVARSIYDDDLHMVQTAFERSHVVKRFNGNDIMNEGYPVEIREVNNAHSILYRSWNWYRDRMIRPDGRVIDPSAGGQTTSEAQSYALLRAVWLDDRATFDAVWRWTSRTLWQVDSGLFSWLAVDDASEKKVVIADRVPATDADQDIALALLFAYSRWGDEAYLTSAQTIIDGIWNHEIVARNDRYYVVANPKEDRDGWLLNPSYFSPATYRIFALVDTRHEWQEVARDVYRTLQDIHSEKLLNNSETMLVPNWLFLAKDGSIGPLNDIAHPLGETAPLYGYDAFRLYWRVALDSLWFQNEEAMAYLEDVEPFFSEEWLINHRIGAAYWPDGRPATTYADISTSAGALAVLHMVQPELAIDMYSQEFWLPFKDGYWQDPENYYAQNWGWFAAALYTNNTPNLWQNRNQLARE